MGKFFKEKILRFFMQKCPLFWSKLDIFPVFCEILQNPPLFEKIPQFPILKNLSPLLGQKSHKTGKFPPFGHTAFMLRMSALAGKQINQSDKGITQNYFVG